MDVAVATETAPGVPLSDYYRLVDSKIEISSSTGFEADRADLHPSNKPHQADAILWALREGRALLAASFGLGKTQIQIEMARLTHERTGGRCLIICPLGVRSQFMVEDGPRLGVTWEYVRTDAEIGAAAGPYLLTNYERVRDGDIDPRAHAFVFVSLDEGSIMRNLGSKTYQVFMDLLGDIPYRYVATATPSPNAYREMIYYAEFLGVMDHGQALTRFFKRNPSKAGDLQINPNHERDYWLWVASWALFLFAPSDLGYSDEGYDLQPLTVHWVRIPADQTRAWEISDSRGQHLLLLDTTLSATAAAHEKRATLPDRIQAMLRIMADNPGRRWLLWHHLEDERRAIEQAVPTAVSVFGAQDVEEKERRLLAFAHGEIEILSTKPSLAGFGCNFQYHCHSNLFVGITYEFEDWIQALHRTHRFQQTHPVDAWVIYAESEDKVAQVLREKWERYQVEVETMRGIVRRYGLNHAAIRNGLRRTIGVERREAIGAHYRAIRNDCVVETATMPADSVGLIHTSIPFSKHYEYTVAKEDFGHNRDDDAFFEQMDYLIPELLRILKPGRIAAVHVKDLVSYGHATTSGFLEIDPFSDKTVLAFMRHGFMYEGRRTIVTDVVRENNGTYRLGWSEMLRDATKMGSGLPEYLLCFRKPPSDTTNARADDPVTHDAGDYTVARWQIDAHSLWRSNGNVLLPREVYDYEAHVGRLEALDEHGNLPKTYFCEPPKSNSERVWDDVNFMQCLNSRQQQRRASNHICPLPLDIVSRTIKLYSNPGDVVFDPFSGLFTVPYMAVRLGRQGYGTELNEAYFEDGVHYLEEADAGRDAPTLFNLIELQEAA